MTDQTADLDQIKRATVVLVTCVVQTLSESDRTAQDRFVRRLEEAYTTLREDPKGGLHVLEMLSWVRELLTGWNFSTGQGEPFLGGVKTVARKRSAKRSRQAKRD